MKYYGKLILILMLVSSCTDSRSIGPNNHTQNTALQTEKMCFLLSSAFNTTIEMKFGTRPSIMSGCEGEYKYFKPSESQGRDYAVAASNANYPEHVNSQGEKSRRLYTLLLIRGVPEQVANEISKTPTFSEVAHETY